MATFRYKGLPHIRTDLGTEVKTGSVQTNATAKVVSRQSSSRANRFKKEETNQDTTII